MVYSTRVGLIDRVPHVEEAAEQLSRLQVAAGDGAARPLTRPSGTRSVGKRGGIAVASSIFLEDCTRTEPAIFAIYMQSSKQPFDSPCNLRTSHSVHRAIFALAAVGRGAILRDGSSAALILMVPAVWLGRPPDRNGIRTDTLHDKVIGSHARGTAFRLCHNKKAVIQARFFQHNRHQHSHLRTRHTRSSRTPEWHKTLRKPATLCHYAGQSSCRLTMDENVRPTRLAFPPGGEPHRIGPS